jgi:hypothetical protein
MGGDDGFFSRTLEGALTGASIGTVAGTMTSFWNSAGVKLNREQVARQVLPTIYANAAYLAGAGATFKAGEALMETWTGKEGEAINSAFGGAVSALSRWVEGWVGVCFCFPAGLPTLRQAISILDW